jgi:Tol biopolymer transport system component
MRADGAALNSIAVLANDTDPDSNPLTVTIEEAPPIGTATANTDGTVRIDSLPGGFKGVTRFRYRVTDPGGLTSVATAVVFVGTDPFRVLFAGDANANGNVEVYVANFLATPTAVTAATNGTLRLSGFLASDNGSTVVYRRADTATPSTTDLSFVQTATPTQQVGITLASGTTLAQAADGSDQYRVSPNGQWIVFVAKDGAGAQAAYVLNVATPATVTKVNVPGAQYATAPRFASNSQSLYLLASPSTNGANKSLYVNDLASSAVSLLSAPNAVASADDVLDYAIAPDQSRALIRANRGGREGLYFINASQLQTEVKVSHALAQNEQILESTLGLAPGVGGSVLVQRVAYTTKTTTILGVPLAYTIYVADVSATPNPRSVATYASGPLRVVGLRPDDGALLYAKDGQILETVLDGSSSPQTVGAGIDAWYDSTGNIALLKQSLPSGGTPPTYNALAVSTRGSFGSTLPLGTPAAAASYFDLSGFNRGVAVLGEGPTTGAAPARARLAVVNAVAPDKLLYLTDFQSPLQLTSAAAQVVSN